MMSTIDTEISVNDLALMLSSQEVSAPADRRAQVTVVVNVPTSEHVAQIVGKCGLKIKKLRESTNTCIKTPLRGDNPSFTITGCQPSVEKACQAIHFASQFFTDLMDSRSNICAVGEVTILVPVPQQYVGVVVGRNGTVIMKIKEQTKTRINTPKDNSQTPAFEVTGNKVNVLAAKEAIEDKVKQAYMLRNSTKFDPNLSHSKFFDKTVGMPSSPPMLSTFEDNYSLNMLAIEGMSTSKALAVFDPNLNQNKPLNKTVGKSSNSSAFLSMNSWPSIGQMLTSNEQSSYDTNTDSNNPFQGLAAFDSYSDQLRLMPSMSRMPTPVPSLPHSHSVFDSNLYFM